MHLYIHLAAFCGMRRGEIQGLTLVILNFDNGLIEVRHSLTVYGEHKGPKSKAGNREVPMPAHLSPMLCDWIVTHYRLNDAQLLFTGPSGVPGWGGFGMSWHRLLARAGFKSDHPLGWHHFHALWHFYTSKLVSGGLPITDEMKLLGHSSPGITLSVYAHARQDHSARKAAIETLVGTHRTLNDQYSHDAHTTRRLENVTTQG